MQFVEFGYTTRHTMPAVTNRAAENPSDEYAPLITASAAGDAAALERLLMKAQEVAYRFSHTVCGGPADAEDVMQDALLKTFRYVKRIRDPHAFRTWLYRTVRNACLMKRRRKAGEPPRLLSLDDVLPSIDGRADATAAGPHRDPEALAINTALRRKLDKALRALPRSYRTVVFLREMEGLSTKDVAGILNMSESNVKMRLHRARLFLRKELEER
jgi:RNA polymerase sigma-70 factor, ECF subfamily